MINKLPKPGQRFALMGSEYEVCFVYGGQVRYAEVIGGVMRSMSLDKFSSLQEKQNLISDHTMQETSSEIPNLLSLSEVEKEQMNRRLFYVRNVMERCVHARSKKQITPVLSKLAKQREDRKPPSVATFSRWVKAYVNANFNPLALVPQHRKKGNRHLRFNFIVEKIIHHRVNQDYLTQQRITHKQLHQNIVGSILDDYAKDEGLPADIDYPSARTISRRVNDLDPFFVSRRRDGEYVARRSFKAAGKSNIANRILEAVEADGNYMDILIVDEETGEVCGRPYATVLIDQYTRCIISIVVTMIPFSSATLLKAMSTGISNGATRPGGLFERMIVDNGSDYISNAVRNLCNTLGITIEHGAPRDPDSKALVERFFKTLNMGVIHLLPGTTYSNPTHKGSYNSLVEAKITLAELNDLASEWIENIYHKTLHEGHGRAPIQLWNESVQNTPVTSYPSADLEVLARSVEQRTISKGRVKVNGLKWYSHALSTLEHYLRKYNITKVDVHIDELDLSHVYIKDPRGDGEFIQADSIKPGYTENLSLYEHQLLQEDLKSKGKMDLARFTEKDLAIARWNLFKKINEYGKGYAKKRIARLKETQKSVVMQIAPVIAPDEITGILIDDSIINVFDDKKQNPVTINDSKNDELCEEDDYYDFEEI